MKIKKFSSNLLIKNTIILIMSSILIKGLSLFNRVILTRLLGNQGISLYVLALPTIMLLLSLAGFNLNVTINKIVSENEITHRYSRKQIIKKATIIGLIFAFFIICIFFLFSKLIAFNLLKQPNTFYPILSSILIVPFVVLNNIFRGFYNGLNKVNITANSNIIEQIARILLSTILLFIFKDKEVTFNVTITVIAMAIGEMIQALYNIIKLKNYLTNEKENQTKNLSKEIIAISSATTLSHLIANISFFLEPIIYTFALSKLNISSDQIMYKYSEITAYALPLLTMFFFISNSIATVIMPSVIKYKNDYDKTNQIIIKSLIASLLPGIIFGFIFKYYSTNYMQFLYNTTIGSLIVSRLGFIFCIFYMQPVLIGILNSYGKQKQLLIISIFDSFIKLILLYFLTFIKVINYNSLIISYLITNIFATLILFIYVKKLLSIKIKATYIIKIIFLVFLTFLTSIFITHLNIHFIISSILMIISFLIYIILIKLHCIDYK